MIENSDWPPTVRAIAAATDDAITAARARSKSDFDDAVGSLDSEDRAQVASIHAEMVRSLLEELHPDGLTGEDVQDALASAVRASAEWYEDLDVPGFVEVLTGALGVADHMQEAAEQRPFPRPEHAILIITDLLIRRKGAAQGYIHRAVGEIRRAQTMEMP
ncbi:hypothetical protein [Rhodococcoides fascians]|uniref:hypothetical protein n=1 Tax=Rhodococcoides fascians TaxID=1828 RepID=UPI00055D2FF2|nr:MULTISPECIES: hypothetical protein [Rhodococcus]OZF03470.1 hypothetical protein CH301_08650 [Rhodococcus sp. 15-1189-1-1a]OZF17274.1 hypothetical protein CH299_09200 [Rhodococcus sp. 14-2686-1-2]